MSFQHSRSPFRGGWSAWECGAVHGRISVASGWLVLYETYIVTRNVKRPHHRPATFQDERHALSSSGPASVVYFKSLSAPTRLTVFLFLFFLRFSPHIGRHFGGADQVTRNFLPAPSNVRLIAYHQQRVRGYMRPFSGQWPLCPTSFNIGLAS